MLAKEAITYKLKLLREDAQSHKALQLSADHLLHGDYHELNLFFDTNDQVTYVFDFEKACIGPRLSELVRSMNIMCFNTFYEKRNFALAREYVRAYDEVYSIKKEEFAKALRAGYNRMKYSLWVEEFHYLEEDTRSDVFLKIGLDTLRWLDEHHQAFEEEVLSWV
jgi:Ser/Thr protein kinase RdoA (MazF antagonist)